MQFLSRSWKLFILPLLFYFIAFIILTYPLIFKFSAELFADTGDGLQNVWNLWWVNIAVTELHQNLWQTNFLHYPYGTSLIGHTLNPLNGLIGVALLRVFSLLETYNVIFIFTFVAGGLTAFALAYYLTRSYWGSLSGGYLYAFSSFHFAHAQGHLQTMSIEWIPLFILSFYIFLAKPTVIKALAASVLLYFNILSDYYYFFYSGLAAVIIFVWYGLKNKNLFFILTKKFLLPFVFFIFLSLATSGVATLVLFLKNANDPLTGSHPASLFSADLLAFIIPGGHSRFNELTKGYWTKLPGNIHESSIYLGLSVILMLVYVWRQRRKIRLKSLYLWFFLAGFFAILSLGPKLHIWGKEITNFPLPYLLLEKVFPFLALSGVPVRMWVMVVLGAAILFAAGFQKLAAGRRQHKLWLLGLLLVLFFDSLPKKVTTSALKTPAYVEFLKKQKDEGGLIDLVSGETLSLYYQTVHKKPLAFGYLARLPSSVSRNDLILWLTLQSGDFDRLCKNFGIKYLAFDQKTEIPAVGKIIYRDEKVKLYDLGELGRCGVLPLDQVFAK